MTSPCNPLHLLKSLNRRGSKGSPSHSAESNEFLMHILSGAPFGRDELVRVLLLPPRTGFVLMIP